ncbi:copper-resistant cuproprotein CopI [Vibrio aestuarianus]|uniref:Copper-binding protein n=1 Tax=Vibrio aestuarianus TaxID=28171 RepID=A0A9X4ESV9_9VIBR|nr:copper-binding protein [Vibrio aestuarianus]MDE1230189.1 copper-binding protein [Vibrio aestuarianus]MDE1241749.1 copper-binding protein [Vibrio aestuarianus]MDE1319418.1 copper-binding protein [Vibrio aestuarianus]MDE1329741.1 copper-binding protein [Vibrio aestuarianus]MDE1336724.1 copper-binding protein [Vibrio aestuarianus]
MKRTLIALTLTVLTTSAIAEMDHSKMDHSKMDHAGMMMDQDQMSTSKMDHSSMDMMMDGMSEVGMPAKGAKPDKVVHVLLSDDMTITFKKAVKIEPNDVVQFVVMNTGKIEHEFSIGSAAEQLKRREMMRQMDGKTHHSENVVLVEPGKAKQLLWHFHGDKNIEFACNIPGHAEAGMVKKIQL